jgi:ergothioneine biosynthesis protein EgtB
MWDDPAQAYRVIRQESLDRCRHLGSDDWCAQPATEASPPKWHLAHTTWFFDTFLLTPHGKGIADDTYRWLFNSYYNAVGPQFPRDRRGLILRPTVEEVLSYRQQVDEAILDLYGSMTADERALLTLGCHHEQQHQELLLTDLKWAWSCGGINPAMPVQRPSSPAVPDSQGPWLTIEPTGPLVDIGHQPPGFAFDNEGPWHRRHLPPYRIARHLVTNGEWLAFMADGGYEQPGLWLDAGWHEVQARGWQAPAYWQQRDGEWWHYTLCGWQAVDPAAPVCHCSFYEAEAFATWAGARLPSEFEWEYAVLGGHPGRIPQPSSPVYPHPLPSFGPAPGLAQPFGAVWQWTRSAYEPYPGFQIADGAVGEYNGKFMSGQYVLRGASCVTPAGHARATYRNFFPAEARWQFSGLRLAQDPS